MDNYSGYIKQEPFLTVYYCVNENITTIEEFVNIEHNALDFASNKKYSLFKTFDTCIDYIFIGKN